MKVIHVYLPVRPWGGWCEEVGRMNPLSIPELCGADAPHQHIWSGQIDPIGSQVVQALQLFVGGCRVRQVGAGRVVRRSRAGRCRAAGGCVDRGAEWQTAARGVRCRYFAPVPPTPLVAQSFLCATQQQTLLSSCCQCFWYTHLKFNDTCRTWV